MPHLYRFSESTCTYTGDPMSKEAKALLGGKGASLVMMSQAGLKVPPGFVIPCAYWSKYQSDKDGTIAMLMAEIPDGLHWLSSVLGYDAQVSIRSGAPVSCPGMMDTLLNVPSDLDAIEAGIRKVFESWTSPRAIEYRKINKIDEKIGTACIVQAMVFGNAGEDCGTGVLFTRDPATGENEPTGEYLINAQGEDIVAGTSTPLPFDGLDCEDPPGVWEKVSYELKKVCKRLEAVYKDMVDIEWTVQHGQLFILQSRVGKRSALAAFQIAYDMRAEGLIGNATALSRITTEQFRALRRPSVHPTFQEEPHLVGIAASPGVASGVPVFSTADALKTGVDCILVTEDTSPDDIAGMNVAKGVLTRTGGLTSHAAVVARAMDKPCVVGCGSLDVEALKGAQKITIDGATGRVWLDVTVPVLASAIHHESVRTCMRWAQTLTGTCEALPGVHDLSRPARIVVAGFWGDKIKLASVLHDLADLPFREHVTLDLRSPGQFDSGDDLPLRDCFGPQPSDGFFPHVHEQLIAHAEALQGLAVLCPGGKMLEALAGVGYADASNMAQPLPQIASAEFALFTILSRTGKVTPTPAGGA